MCKKLLQQLLLPAFMGIALLTSASLSAGPPEQSGPNVYRWQGDMWFDFSANGLIAFVGIDVPLFCDEFVISAATGDYQSVLNPSDLGLEMVNARLDDAMTFVYPASYAFDDDGNFDAMMLCGHIWDGDMEIASGTSDAVSTDNDAWAFDFEHKRTNSWHISVHGVLYTPTEDPVVLNGGFHCVYRGGAHSGNGTYRCKSRLNLTD
jgi:hypothetical protein